MITISLSAIGGRVSVDPAAQGVDGEKSAFVLDSAGGLACLDLRRVMYQPGSGTWYCATIQIDSGGKLSANFDYDKKPYRPDQEGREDIREALMHDHEKFPRENANLPDWHPAKQ